MKITIHYWSLCLLLVSGILLSCSETKEPSPLSFTKAFTGNDHLSWKAQFVVLKQTGKGDQKFTLSSCESDDIYTFYAGPDRLYNVDDHGTACTDGGTSYNVADTWSYHTATATLNIIIPPLADQQLPFFIRSISDSQMVLEIFLDQDNTSSYRIYFSSTQTK